MSAGCREEPLTPARGLLMYGTRFYWQYALWYMVWDMAGHIVWHGIWYIWCGMMWRIMWDGIHGYFGLVWCDVEWYSAAVHARVGILIWTVLGRAAENNISHKICRWRGVAGGWRVGGM